MPCPDCDGLPERVTALQEQYQALEIEHALAVILLTDADSLIRYLRPDLDATRPRADDLLERISAFVADSSPASRPSE